MGSTLKLGDSHESSALLSRNDSNFFDTLNRPREMAVFIRQLKRRDESGHAVFRMQDSLKATQGAILVRNAGKWNAHTEKNSYRSALFRRILKETGRLEFIIMLSP